MLSLLLNGNQNKQNTQLLNDNNNSNKVKHRCQTNHRCTAATMALKMFTNKRVTGFLSVTTQLWFVILFAQQLLHVGGQNITTTTTTSLSSSLLNQTVPPTLDHCEVVQNNIKVYKTVGSVWISLQDACSLHSCELNKQGVPEEVVTRDNCGDFYCDIDSEVRPKEDSCCGECVRTKCRFKDVVYAIGQTWHNTEDCTLNECSQLPNGQPIINSYQKTCPPLPTDCPAELIYTENCCQYCNQSKTDGFSVRSEGMDSETDDVWTDEYYSKHHCVRDCQKNEVPKTCHYTFVVEWYETLSKACYNCPGNLTDCQKPHCITGDGIARSITVVNRMMPGPSIEVCQNDVVVVDVKNHLLGESTTIHWHGMHMKDTPYMDGVPHITQCPISPHSTFRYTFKAENTGTHFWHSHTGMQRGDGVFGALIVKRPRTEDPHGHLYDFDLAEHKMIVQDWVHVPGISMFASHHHSKGDNKPFNILINGKGRFYKAIWNKIKEQEKPQGRTVTKTDESTTQASTAASSTSTLSMETTTSTTTTSEPRLKYTEKSSAVTNTEATPPVLEDEVVFLHPLDDANLNNMRIQQNEISRLARLVQSNNQFKRNTQKLEESTQENSKDFKLLEAEETTLKSTKESKFPENETYLQSPQNNRTKRSIDAEVPLELVPLQVYNVRKGFRYRFRLINAEFLNCPIQISIDNHTLTALNSDGYDFEAVDVGSIVTYAGERFDFVVNADQLIGNYWIRLKGLMDCDERFTSAFQVAILHYEEAEQQEPSEEISYDHKPVGIELNTMNKGPGHVDSLTIAEINALPYYDRIPGIDRDALKPVADYKFFVYYDFYRKDNPEFHPSEYYGMDANITNSNRVFTPQLNHISLQFPSVALLPSRDELNDSLFCNETSLQQKGIDCRKDFCKCHHVLQVPLNSIVELIIIDEGFTYDANHPFHLHGNAFRVVGLERLGANVTVEMVKQLDRYNLLKRNLVRPPVKDTVTVPDGGYTIVRFEAHNPGFWLFHCHIEFHAEIGMALVLKVGDNDEMVPVPKNFPTCHDYMPMANEEDDNENSIATPALPGDSGDSASQNNSNFILSLSIITILIYFFS